ncbi:MAG: DUF4349 domain-containing protein [Dehalococcoidia bacterium]|nr:DUF4349 domain-containing protein [Dehalococcoidia bacterium]
MKRLSLLSLMLALFVLVVSACAEGGPSGTSVAPAAPRPALAPAQSKGAATNEGPAPADAARLIVRQANISILVNDVPASASAVQDMASRFGGYVVSTNRTYAGDQPMASVTIRVTAARFDEAMVEIRKMAVRPPTENINAQDVTEEYSDLQAQLRNAEATEKQYLALLDRAQTVEDVLKVQQQLSNIRGQIERLKGRILFLDRTTTTSLISVDIRAVASAAPIVEPNWLPVETLKSALRGLVQTAQVLANIAIWLAIFSPLWVSVTVLVVWLVRRRRRAKAASAPLPPQGPAR